MLQPLAVIDGRTVLPPKGPVFCPVLHQPHPGPQGRRHHGLEPWHRAAHQIKVALGQELPALLAAPRRLKQIHLQVVDAVTEGGSFAGQLRIDAAAKFLQHPQGFMHPPGIGAHNLGRAQAFLLGGMAHARCRVGGGVARQLVVIAVQPAQALAHVLGPGHQIGPIHPKAGPVFQHPQPLARAIEVGVKQPGHGQLIRVGGIGRTHGEMAWAV